MEPLEAALAIVPVASECTRVLVHVAAPRLHPRLAAALPPGGDAAALRALFDRFAAAAACLEQNEGLLAGADRFVRAARTLRKMQDAMVGWHPSLQEPPANAVAVARTALKHLGFDEPEAGWDAYDDAAGPDGG